MLPYDELAARGGFDRAAEVDLLAARLRAAEGELAAAARGTAGWLLARQRIEVLLAELDVANRRWGLVTIPDEPAPDPSLDARLRRLAHARLESERQILRARQLLETLRADDR